VTVPVTLGALDLWGRPADAAGPSVDWPLQGLDRKRQKVLEQIPGDPTSLVNVSYEHLPATDDMTMLGKPALPALERGLTHNVNPSTRLRLASVLAELADHHSREALLSALKDWDASVRRQAIRALAAIGDAKAIPALRKIAEDPEEEDYVKAMAFGALGRLGAREAAPLLLASLGNDKANLWLRRSALSALWDMRLALPAPTLRQALTKALAADRDPYLKTFAAAAAAELRDADPAIRAALTASLRDRNEDVHNVAVYALGEIGNPASVAPIRARLATARSARLLNNIAFALRKLGDPKVMDLLGSLLGHQLAVIRLNAAFVLGDIKDRRALPLLAKALADPNDLVRASAISALGKLGDPAAIPHLEPFTTGKNLTLKQEAFLALGQLAPRQYADRIAAELLWHESGPVRRAAAMALARLGDPRAQDALTHCYATSQCSVVDLASGLKRIPGDRVAGPLLVAYTRAPASYGAKPILRTLGQRTLDAGHRDVLRSVLNLNAMQPSPRRALLRFLGRLGEPRSRADFWRLLRSRDPLTRQNAAYALANQRYPQGHAVLANELTQAAPRIKRGVADLLRSLTDPEARKAALAAVRAALTGHGPFSRLAAAYALMGWEPAEGARILVEALGDPSRLVRNEAAYYLMRPENREHRGLLETALRTERRTPVQGTLRRLIRHLTPGALKAKIADAANL
jgi:HEAT repeat protein